MELPPHTLLEVFRPLHGIPDIHLPWYLTYTHQQVDQMGVFLATTEPCVLIHREEDVLSGLVTLEMDAAMAIGNPDFYSAEESASKED